MREILFRGKCGSKWHYGDLYTQSNTPQIIAYNKKYDKMDTAFVDPETVGQYTGLRDCKRTKEYPEGQKIFEGDIVRYKTSPPKLVIWDADAAMFVVICRVYGKECYCTMCGAEHLEVIGNIHDNPELLKGGDSE